MTVHDRPLYHEIAFNNQQVKKQIDFIEEAAKKYDNAPAKRFLDICCGPPGNQGIIPQLRMFSDKLF